ncbi:hypothetical protein SEA_NAIRB_44 [Mycobacterium phage Nairb]|uniref:SsDNA binding protein n=5 Tax=Bernalvirus bernal13 TaxID=1982102 RepID=A0A2P1JRW5_9CAUD|nr:hypothetical protein FH37_gp44 [Mycobacterium phage Bernal13]AIT13458.1 hypothetical protein PBI_RONRAYGUN_45 [Mycobacterium phage RonRayGun]ASJ79125.1 hypothetical protein SEA_ZENTIME222_44 [Mycobacterium phage ZenTime222]AVO21832.1 hypothetical protein SEA_NAIRB_44 [Mycobacterium phage Nairb]QBP28890.1 hypothetical protein SEA_IBRAHIM_45 [Mycobacterium phage Ibrahim]QHB47449.1 hypothetical protein SEA_WHITTY_44 [Mycobacterium phage Whitty]
MSTTANEIQRYNPAGAMARPAAGSQATTIEQSRAIAEVQAAVVVAQNCPRDMARAEHEMRDSCGRLAMASRAFYQVTNRGTGPSVHLMRELARIWGNVQYGVTELARNDDKGESEVQAWAWDVQTNTRSTRTFIVPHQKMVKVNGQRTRRDLDDLQDVYLNNQNIGARAVRECISTVLPTWFTETAQDICRDTLENGEGVPLGQRIENMVNAFAAIDITAAQLEVKVGKKVGQFTAADVAQLGIAYTSITREGFDKAELFPPLPSSTADEIAAPAPAPAAEQPKARRGRRPKADQPKADQAANEHAPAKLRDDVESAPKPAGETLVDFPEQPGIDPEPAAEQRTFEPPADVMVDLPDDFEDQPITGSQTGRLFSLRAKFPELTSTTVEGKAKWSALLTAAAGREISDTRDLKAHEAAAVLDVLEAKAAEA